MAKSASVLLNTLCISADVQVIDFVFDLIKEYIANENGKIKESVLMAYGSILETRHSEKIKYIIEGSLPTLIIMLGDKSIDVRTTVSWVIKKICKYHTDSLKKLQYTNNTLLNEFIQVLIKYLTSNKKIVSNICESFSFMSENLNKESNLSVITSFLSEYYSCLFDNLMQIAYMKDGITTENNIPLASFYCLISLIDNAPQDCIDFIKQYFPNFINCLQASLDKKNFENDEIRGMYQEYICSTISAFLCDSKIILNLDQGKFLYGLVKEIFLERCTVFDSGIMMCSSIALNIGKDFIQILPDYGNFLFHALGLWNIESVCNAALMSVSELIRSLGECFEPYVDQFLPLIFNIIEVNFY